MKSLRILLAFSILCSISSADEKASILRIFETASVYLNKEERFTSVENLQKDGLIIAYFFSLEENEEKKKIGILVDVDLNVSRSVSIEELTSMRYSPPQIKEIIHTENRRFNMPTISEEEYLKKGLEPGEIANI